MHVSNFALAAAATASTRARAAAKPAGVNVDASVPAATESMSADHAPMPRECNAATANAREFTWVFKSLARMAAVWRRRSRTE
jgi:hypothetical protein